MRDTLERERLLNNLIDRLFALEERVGRLEELLRELTDLEVIVPEPAVNGRWRLIVEDLGGDVGPVLVGEEL